MRHFVHTAEDGRIDGFRPEFIENTDWDTGGAVLTPNVREADLEAGWFPFFEDGSHEWDFGDYRIVEGELVHDPPPPVPPPADPMERWMADTDAALCELCEAQEEAQAVTDAALCEIYEMLIAAEGE